MALRASPAFRQQNILGIELIYAKGTQVLKGHRDNRNPQGKTHVKSVVRLKRVNFSDEISLI